MKKIRKALLTVSVLCLAFATMGACKSNGSTTKNFVYSFNTNGGNEIANVTVKSGDTYTLPVPEKEGYSFEGWYTDAEFTGEPVTEAVASANVTYYAKWQQLAAISLEVDGEVYTTLYAKAGENLFELVKDYAPEKEGLTFGAWFNGTKELTNTTKVPEGGVTLTAKYKVAYTVELYKSNIAGTDYEKTTETYEGFVGEEIVADESIDGFKEVEEDGTVNTITLTEKASENVIVRYFDRKSFTVTFNPSIPSAAGVTFEKEKITKVYEDPIEMYTDYVCEGYVLVGWATTSGGKVEYKANYISTVLYNKDGENSEVDSVTPDKDIVLYGVWSKGYTDFFGGNDYVYVLDTAGKVAYLSRGSVYYEGEYNSKSKTFGIYDEKDVLMAEGKLYDSKTFIYYSETRDEFKASLSKKGGDGAIVVDEKVTVDFDAYNGITYTDNGKVSKGTYTYKVEESYYVASFTEGTLKGKKITFIVGKAVDGGNTFTIRGDEASWGKLSRFAVEEGELVQYNDEYSITLDGFGKAIYVNNGQEKEYFYELTGDINGGLLVLKDSAGDLFGNAVLMKYGSTKGYCRYTENTKQTYEFKTGEKLVTDGGCIATYTKNGKTVNGFYQISESLFGGTLITMLTAEGNFVFTMTTVSEKVPVLDDKGNETGETETITTSTLVEKDGEYKEYRYQDKEGSEKKYVIAFNEPTADKATLYAYKSGSFVKVSTGSYEWNEEENNYLYTAEEYFNPKNVVIEPFDPNEIASIIFAVDGETLDVGVCYWYTVVDKAGETAHNVYEYTEYEAEDGATLKLVGGYAFFTQKSGVTVAGPTSVNSSGLVTMETTSSDFYFEIDHDAMTFIQLQFRPYSARFMTPDGMVSQYEEFVFDGKGGVVYKITEYAKEDGEEDTITEYPGTYAEAGDNSAFEAIEYIYTSNDGSQPQMRFITLKNSSGINYVSIYNNEYNGNYESKVGILKLDGYSLNASFIDAKSVTHDGRYTINTEDDGSVFVKLTDRDTEEVYYFDLKADRSFTQRGTEYGEYLLTDNHYVYSYCEFNGYGKLKVYTKEYNAETNKYERNYIDENGTYTINGGVIVITYKTSEEETRTIEGAISTYVESGAEQAAFVAKNKFNVRIYVNQEDWSTLTLDEYGTAIKYTSEGVKEEGYYVFITDEFLYYENKDGSDACLFKYDYKKGEATPIKYEPRGYYTSELEALHFSESGYAIFGGETSYFYKYEGGKVTIYRQDPESKSANKYGFVEEDFGAFTAEKEWNGKHYYENNGFAINFDRSSVSDTLYPVLLKETDSEKSLLGGLSFQPSGSGEFSTTGTVYIGGKPQTCKVLRAINEETGEAELYIQWNFYRFYIQVNYTGVDDQGNSHNSYEIVRMQYVNALYSYSYLEMYAFYASFGIYGLEDMCGMVTIMGEYDEQGNAGEFHIEGDFLEGLRIRDLTGELISFNNGTYAYDATTNVYSTRFTAGDGKNYGLHFQPIYQAAFDMNAYGVMAFTYEQEFDLGEGYVVEVEKVLWTQAKAVEEDTVYALRMYKDGVEIPHEGILASGDTIYYIVRERAEPAEGETVGKITKTIYHKIDFVRMEEGTPVGDDRELEVYLFDSATRSEENVKTVYSSAEQGGGKLYVDFSLDREEFTIIAMAKRSYLAQETVYDEATDEYTVTVSGGKVFTVKFLDENTVYIMEKSDM